MTPSTSHRKCLYFDGILSDKLTPWRWSVSNFAAISCAYNSHIEGQKVRYCSITIFLMLYLTFVIMFGIRLNYWDDSTPGQCYSSSRIAIPDGLHPIGDQIYIAITSLYCFALLSAATIDSRIPNRRDNAQKTVIFMGSLQFVLHVYMAISLRISNQSLLDNPSVEEKWGFGQILAVVMLGATVIQCGVCLEGINIYLHTYQSNRWLIHIKFNRLLLLA